jgi:hypothetical protein
MNRYVFCNKGSNCFDGDAFSPDTIPECVSRIAIVAFYSWKDGDENLITEIQVCEDGTDSANFFSRVNVSGVDQ